MNFADRLDDATSRCGNPCLVGLDAHLDLLPEEFSRARDTTAPRAERARLLGDFLLELVELAANRVPAVKPQAAFFEVLGADGMAAWERVVRGAKEAGLLVIGDVKRSDIASSARAYATAYLDDAPTSCDAITVNPYLGGESIEPFLEVCARAGAGLYVLVRTSNPGSKEFQHHGAPHLADVVARSVAAWGRSQDGRLMGECGLSSVGAVVGATHAAELAHFRKLMPETPFLLPGFGAQGATDDDVAPAFLAGGRGGLVNSSRGVAFAWQKPEHAGKHWKDAASDALDEMIVSICDALARSSA